MLIYNRGKQHLRKLRLLKYRCFHNSEVFGSLQKTSYLESCGSRSLCLNIFYDEMENRRELFLTYSSNHGCYEKILEMLPVGESQHHIVSEIMYEHRLANVYRMLFIASVTTQNAVQMHMQSK